MWTRSKVLALCLAGAVAPEPAWGQNPARVVDDRQGRAFEQWIQGDDPVLVLLVFEGMRGDALERTRRGGEPLMPRLNELAASSLVFSNCFTTATVPLGGAFELFSGRPGLEVLQRTPEDDPWPGGLSRLVEAGFTATSVVAPARLHRNPVLGAAFPWAFGADAIRARPGGTHEAALGLATVDSLLNLASEAKRAQLVMFFCDVLVPPYPVDDADLDRADPAPWTGMREARDLDENRRDRIAAARAAGERLESPRLTRIRRDRGTYAWMIDAAHVRADAVIGQIWDRVAATGLSHRASLLITSTAGTAVGDRGRVGSGNGVHHGHVHVPLIWRFPSPIEVSARSQAPVQLMDVAATLALRLPDGAREALPGSDLFGELSSERVRVSHGWYRSRPGGRVSPRGEVRMTTPRLTLLALGPEDNRLFDLEVDPIEYEDVAAWEPDLALAMRERLDRHLFSSAPEIRILIKGHPGQDERDADVLGGRVALSASPVAVDGVELEPMDVVDFSGDAIVHWSLLTDGRGDLIRIRLGAGAPSVRLELDTPGAARRWPLHVGLRAWPLDDARTGLEPYTTSLLRAVVRSPAVDMVRWGEGRPAGIYVWIVPDEAEAPGISAEN